MRRMYAPHVRQHALSLIDTGLSVADVSRRIGVNRSTLYTWDRDRSLVDKYGDTDLCPRCEPLPRPPAPAHTYAHLLGLYLGDGCISPAGDPRKQVWRPRITCDNAWPGLIAECERAVAAIRPHHRVSRVPCEGRRPRAGGAPASRSVANRLEPDLHP